MANKNKLKFSKKNPCKCSCIIHVGQQESVILLGSLDNESREVTEQIVKASGIHLPSNNLHMCVCLLFTTVLCICQGQAFYHTVGAADM